MSLQVAIPEGDSEEEPLKPTDRQAINHKIKRRRTRRRMMVMLLRVMVMVKMTNNNLKTIIKKMLT